jgi:hypothetical protein
VWIVESGEKARALKGGERSFLNRSRKVAAINQDFLRYLESKIRLERLLRSRRV